MEIEKKACLEHVDMALDDFVNEQSCAPEMAVCKDGKCDYCHQKAVYLVKKPKFFQP
jgi:CxxH/CxxC protein (TIGR04129 family)